MDDLQMADRVALQELKACYFRYLDTKEWASWRDLFADDLLFYGDIPEVAADVQPTTTTADEWVEMVSALLADAVTVHQGHTPEFHFSDDRNAHGIWSMYSLVSWLSKGGHEATGTTPGAPGTSTQRFGHYHEHYVKGSDGRWRFKEIRLVPLRLDYTASAGAVAPRQAPPSRRAVNV